MKTMIAGILIAASPLLGEEAPNYFSLGVQSYLRQDYEAAAGQLKSAIERDQDKEKAEKLLLKVLLEGSKHYQSRGEISKAENWANKANELFPSAPEVRAVSVSFKRKEAAKPARLRMPLPAAPKAPEAAASKAAEVPAAASEPKENKEEGKNNWILWAVSGYGILVLAFSFLIWNMRRRTRFEILKMQESFSAQIHALKEALQNEESQKHMVMRELESRRDMLRLIESALKKEPVDSAQGKSAAQIPPLIAPKPVQPSPAPSVPIVHVEEVVKEQEQRKLAAQEKLKALKNIRPTRAQAQFQKKQILETLIKITPDEREESQRRIAAQAMNLYESFPKEAAAFLKELAQDADSMVRLNMIPALAQMPPEISLEMLCKMLSDDSSEVKREALKALKILRENKVSGAEKALAAEIAKLEWVI